MPSNLETLRGLARRFHVYYDVEHEQDIRDQARVTVAFLVRLWGVHPRGAHALPGCAKCHELRSRLQEIAEFAMPAGSDPSRIEIEPLRPALYDSRVIPGADEIALRIRLGHRDEEQPVDAHDERLLKEIREKLRKVDVRER